MLALLKYCIYILINFIFFGTQIFITSLNILLIKCHILNQFNILPYCTYIGYITYQNNLHN